MLILEGKKKLWREFLGKQRLVEKFVFEEFNKEKEELYIEFREFVNSRK